MQQKVQVQPESAVPGMSPYLDSLKWSKDGLVPVIVQVSDAAAVSSTSVPAADRHSCQVDSC